MKVLVCNAETENSLGVIRSLGRRGIPVIAAFSQFFAKGRWSKYVSKAIKEPLTDTPDQYVKWLISTTKEHGVNVFLPTADILVWIASNWRDEIKQYIRVPLAPKEILDIALRKDLTCKACQEYGVPYPRTYYPVSYQELKSLANEIEYPVIVKPRTSVGVILEGKGFVANSKEELVSKFRANRFKQFMQPYLEQDPALEWPLVQEFVRGEITNLYAIATVFNTNSKPTGIFCGRKIRQWPVQMGVGTLTESSYNADAVRASIRLLRRIRWEGAVATEIKKDSKDGEFKIIELNPRTHSWTWLAVETGVDIPYLWYRHACGDIDSPKAVVSKGNLAWLYWLTDLFGLPSQLSFAEDRRKFIKQYLGSLGRDKVHAVLNKKDPLPFFADLINALRYVPSYIKRLRQ